MTKFAFVFPGQGSQARGMMNGYADFPVVRDTFAEASSLLQQDLWQLVTEGSDAELNATVNTQPIMLTAGIAVYRAWRSLHGPAPALLAGHSLGEYTALVAGGAIEFADALPLVRYRAGVMQQAVPEGVGGIAVILGLDDDSVRAVCREAAQGEVLEAINYNSPGQVVIAGHRAAVERGMELAIPVLHNADVKSYTDAASIKDALVRQLYLPVRWVETVQYFGQQGITHNVECAPGKVLAGLNKRIDTKQQALALNDGEALKAALVALA